MSTNGNTKDALRSTKKESEKEKERTVTKQEESEKDGKKKAVKKEETQKSKNVTEGSENVSSHKGTSDVSVGREDGKVKTGRKAKKGQRQSNAAAKKKDEKKKTVKGVWREHIATRGHIIFKLPDDEVDLRTLKEFNLEDEDDKKLLEDCLHVERYKFAIEGIVNALTDMMRRGNELASMTAIVSDRGTAVPERLYKSVFQTAVIWGTSTEHQPMLNEAIKANCAVIAQVERLLQKEGPPQLKKTRNFLNGYRTTYVLTKKNLATLFAKNSDSVTTRKTYVDEVKEFIKTYYTNQKMLHMKEIREAFSVIEFYHKTVGPCWENIQKKEKPKSSKPVEYEHP